MDSVDEAATLPTFPPWPLPLPPQVLRWMTMLTSGIAVMLFFYFDETLNVFIMATSFAASGFKIDDNVKRDWKCC